MVIFDIETDGLLDELTKIHVLAWMGSDGQVHHTHDYEAMRLFFTQADVLIGHNIIRFDIPAVEKVLGIKVEARLIDTLALSWYLNHDRAKHGLEGYGEDYGVPKPKIDDWENLTPEEYAHRCREDVKINTRLYRDLMVKMNEIYDDKSDMERMVDYLSFKLDCAREQEALRWKLDVDKAMKYLEEWEALKEEKTNKLADEMPIVVKYKTINKPSSFINKDGSPSKAGEKWYEYCNQFRKDPTSSSITIPAGTEKGNPNSTDQVKDWLWSLGWEPKTFKYVKHKVTGLEKNIPQIRRESDLCPSVLDLIEKEPKLELLDGLSVLTHRIGILKSFVECHQEGWLEASVAGLTNTLRFRHARPLVNLPSVDKPYGAEIRGCLIAPEGYTLCGSDMTSLEDTTKRHYIQPLDPGYVAEMSHQGFDPHLDLAKFAGDVTQDEIDAYNEGKRPDLKKLRKSYKVVNYSATYGVGAAKLARETGMSQSDAKKLLNAFWKRNWAVQTVADRLQTKDRRGYMWVKNPVSNFWYSLRSEKDRFSTLNQGTGVFCFDTWVSNCRARGLKTVGQFHDEIICVVRDGEEDWAKAQMEDSINKTNETVKLNVPLGIDVQFGKNYSEIH